MSKKKKCEQPIELNDAALEATSGGTIFVRASETSEDGLEWAYTDANKKIVKNSSFTDALVFNSAEASDRRIKKMEKDGWSVWSLYDL